MMKKAVFLLFSILVLAISVAWPEDDIGALRAKAEGGDLSAQLKVARTYFLGLGVAKDEAEGARWFLITAGRGEPQSQRIIGLLYELGGAGLHRDDVQAASWLQKAADQNDAIAESRIALMHEEGRGGLAKDPALAAGWYRKAAEQGNAAAQAALGRLYEQGQGVAKDDAAALSWYRKAADQGDAGAQNSAALLCITSRNPEVRDPNAGLNFALAAVKAKRDDPVLLSTLARAYYVEGRFEEAVRTQASAVTLVPTGKKKEYQDTLSEYQRDWDRSKEESPKSRWGTKPGSGTAPVAR